jgi:hypothetical protein
MLSSSAITTRTWRRSSWTCWCRDWTWRYLGGERPLSSRWTILPVIEIRRFISSSRRRSYQSYSQVLPALILLRRNTCLLLSKGSLAQSTSSRWIKHGERTSSQWEGRRRRSCYKASRVQSTKLKTNKFLKRSFMHSRNVERSCTSNQLHEDDDNK